MFNFNSLSLGFSSFCHSVVLEHFFRKKETFYVSATEYQDKKEKTKLNQMITKI